MLTRRHALITAFAAPAILRFGTGTARAATSLKISHQFPGGSIAQGDFRDRLCRTFAAEVAKRSGGEIAAEVFPDSQLVKTTAQFAAMRKGALDISLYPLPYAGGELPDSMLGPVSKWMDELSIYPDELFTIMAQRAAIYATAESFT